MDPNQDPFEGDEDAALRYAIELSLQDLDTPVPPPTSQKHEVIDLEGDQDVAPKKSPKKPVKSSGGDHLKAEPAMAMSAAASSAAPQTAPPVAGSNNIFALLGLDRKKMEEERLARAAKRKAPPDDHNVEQHPPRRAKIAGLTDQKSQAPVHTTAESPTLPYPKGVVKKTWVSGCPRQDDIKIEEVFQKDQLQLAVLSSFGWDEEWLLSKVDINKTMLTLVAHAQDEAQKASSRANVPADRIRFCFPPMPSSGTMHSKLQLLKFPGYMRIVIPTGNLVPYDWGESGVMENMVFLIDLPIAKEATKPMTDFGQELIYFLKASGLDEVLIGSLLKYDFSETERYRFVHTIAHNHVGEAWKRTGHGSLGRAVKSLGLETQSRVELDFVTASLGALKTDFISALYGAAQGDNGTREYERRYGGGGKKKKAQKAELSYQPDDFRIYFPSYDTVAQSRGGTPSGGTICVQREWYEAATFPRELLHECKSVRPGVLMHSKLIFVRHASEEKSPVSWAYLGSANLSESAWGALRKARTGLPVLQCRNWECGVVIPMDGKSDERGLKVFEQKIPVPMVVPSEAYGKTKSKSPWYFKSGDRR